MADPLPLRMAGSLTGTTIHIEGDAGNFHFSGQFHIHQQPNSLNVFFPAALPNPLASSFPPAEIREEEKDQILLEPTSYSPHETSPYHRESSSPLVSPSGTSELPDSYRTPEDQCVRTRLRSGVISPVAYFQTRRRCGDPSVPVESPSRRRRRRRRRKETGGVLERLLRRRSLPVRPCSSYNFFVMANWGSVRAPSFEGTVKSIGELWHGLPESDKQEYAAMASKDKARYNKQCAALLMVKQGSRLRLED